MVRGEVGTYVEGEGWGRHHWWRGGERWVQICYVSSVDYEVGIVKESQRLPHTSLQKLKSKKSIKLDETNEILKGNSLEVVFIS